MSFESVIKEIEWFINHRECHSWFVNDEWMKMFIGIFERVFYDLRKLENNELIIDREKTTKEILSILDMFLDSITSNDITEEQKKFIENFCLLVFNWNQSKSIKINTTTDYIKRVFENNLTLYESNLIHTKIMNKFSRVQNWLPPSINISKHYYRTIMDKG